MTAHLTTGCHVRIQHLHRSVNAIWRRAHQDTKIAKTATMTTMPLGNTNCVIRATTTGPHRPSNDEEPSKRRNETNVRNNTTKSNQLNLSKWNSNRITSDDCTKHEHWQARQPHLEQTFSDEVQTDPTSDRNEAVTPRRVPVETLFLPARSQRYMIIQCETTFATNRITDLKGWRESR